MDKRIQTGDKFEVIDKESLYYGQTVIFIKSRPRQIYMINHIGKVIDTKEEVIHIFKIDNTETRTQFTFTQLKNITKGDSNVPNAKSP